MDPNEKSSVKVIEVLEFRSDKNGTGSVFRACLAIHRCCREESFSNLILELGKRYCATGEGLDHLSNFCKDHFKDSSGEFREGVIALQNAIGLAQEQAQHADDMWLRLGRII